MHDHDETNRNQLSNPETAQLKPRLWRYGLIMLVIAVAVAAFGITRRINATSELKTLATDTAVPTVALIKPEVTQNAGSLVLPGQLSPLNSAAIYAQTSGYLREWYVDMGDKVKKGQKLAVLDAPELEHQLMQARADYNVTATEQEFALKQADRVRTLQNSNSDVIAMEEVERRIQDSQTRTALAEAAQANIQRLESLKGFTQLTAPFDGVVTSRAAQIGDLVTAGAVNASPLFTVSDISRIRIYVRIPQNSIAQIKNGLEATLSVPERPDQQFKAKVIRSAGAVDPQSGTVLIELQTDNKNGVLIPGAYAQVKFELAAIGDLIRIPGGAILYRDSKPSVITVDEDNKVKLQPVTIGRDEGNTVIIASGITAEDRVVATPPDAIRTGDRVKIKGEQNKSQINKKT